MRLTLIALLLAGVAGCGSEPVSEFEATRKAADQGLAMAQSNLGLMYDDGTGVPEDYTLAEQWFRKAAEQGYAEAQFNLGELYAEGDGVSLDYVEAYAWWNLAAAQGIKSGGENRDKLKQDMSSSDIAKAQQLSIKYYKQYAK